MGGSTQPYPNQSHPVLKAQSLFIYCCCCYLVTGQNGCAAFLLVIKKVLLVPSPQASEESVDEWPQIEEEKKTLEDEPVEEP